MFFAYMAETYVHNVSAPDWRRMSGTRNGIWVSLFINSLSGSPLADKINEVLPGDGSPLDKAFLAWLMGELEPSHFSAWPRFRNAILNRLETVIAEA